MVWILSRGPRLRLMSLFCSFALMILSLGVLGCEKCEKRMEGLCDVLACARFVCVCMLLLFGVSFAFYG